MAATKTPNDVSTDPDLITTEETVTMLRLSQKSGRRTLYNWERDGLIKGYRVGGSNRVLYKRADVIALIERGREYPPRARGAGIRGHEREHPTFEQELGRLLTKHTDRAARAIQDSEQRLDRALTPLRAARIKREMH